MVSAIKRHCCVSKHLEKLLILDFAFFFFFFPVENEKSEASSHFRIKHHRSGDSLSFWEDISCRNTIQGLARIRLMSFVSLNLSAQDDVAANPQP